MDYLTALDHLLNLVGAVGYHAPAEHFSSPLPVGYRHLDRCFIDIQPDKHATLHSVSPPFLRLGTGQPGATLERRMPQERPLTQSAQANMGSRI